MYITQKIKHEDQSDDPTRYAERQKHDDDRNSARYLENDSAISGMIYLQPRTVFSSLLFVSGGSHIIGHRHPSKSSHDENKY